MPSKKEETQKVVRSGTYARTRLHVDAVHLGHRRSKRHVHHSSSLVQIQGVQQRTDAQWYLGKRVVYEYRIPNPGKGQVKNRRIWGKVVATHGNTGVVRCRFTSNLPSISIGQPLKVFMFPSNI